MITIMIPTQNRPNYLKRILRYYNDYETAYDIIIADSSSDENKQINRKTVSSLPSINISHMDEYPSEVNPYNKIVDALENVNTKYCVFCADADFITPNGITQSVDFLEHNPDFTVAHGYYISFRLENTENGQQFWSKRGYSPESITFPDPKKRLTHHLSNYSPTFYAVHRIDMLRMIFKETLTFTDDYRFGELLPSMIELIYGKLKCLDILYSARQNRKDVPDSTNIASKNLMDFISDGSYNEKYDRFRYCLSIHLNEKSQLAIEESKKVIDAAMSSYMKPYMEAHIKSGSPNSKKKSMISKIRNSLDYLNLPDWMDERIRALYRKLFLPRKMDDSLIPAEIPPSSECYEDFNKIRHHVLAHSQMIPK